MGDGRRQRGGGVAALGGRPAAGAHELLARATDLRGNTLPEVAQYNEPGYLFNAVVRLPVVAA